MIAIGVILVILGVGSLLPSLGFDLAFLDWLDPYQPWAGIIVAALGLVTVLFGAQRRGRREVAEALAAAAPAAAAAPTAGSPPAAAAPAESAPGASATERLGEPTLPASTTPPAPTPTVSERAWPTEPPERSDDD